MLITSFTSFLPMANDKQVATSSDTIQQLYRMTVEQERRNIITNTSTEIQNLKGSKTLIVAMEECNELAIELMNCLQTFAWKLNKKPLIEETSDVLLNIPYIIISQGFDETKIMNSIQPRINYLIQHEEDISICVQEALFPDMAKTCTILPLIKHLMLQVKMYSKYLRTGIADDNFFTTMTDALIVIYCIIQLLQLPQSEIADMCDYKLKRMQHRLETNTL